MSQVVIYQEAAGKIPEQPRARSGLLRRLWEGLGIPDLVDQLGISKYSGLPADALLFVHALFGVVSARSIQHLIELAVEDVLLQELLPVLDGLNDKSLRRLLKRTEPVTYRALQGEIIRVLQDDPLSADLTAKPTSR